ncbi:2-methoxy-6-polyprenyl-1,4-benzoquinol methylase, mitochondrial [subsurface metagenome]
MCFLFIIFVIVRIIRKIYKFPIPAFATRLIDNPFRRRLIQKPELIAERMQLKPGMTVVEIGPGKGSYTKAIAKKIQPNGKVFAIDIQESIINRLKKKIKKENIQNIIPKIEDAYNLSFEDESVDRIFAITCLPEIPDPIRALREFKRILKPDGIISLSELFLDPDYPLRRTEKRWAKEAGLDFYEGFGNWFVYQLNFIKKKPSY